jgi:transcriptional regulator with PAS, ATPase and Fis domain
MRNARSDNFVGNSVAIRAVREEIHYAARSDAKVLVTGDSGVGKEVVAHLVHAESARRTSAFVTINCAGVPESLLESELFGHERGSFTGAYRGRVGLLEQANHGTVFMDEVGEMSLRMQTMLLRFLETGEIQRVGGEGPQSHVDARVIAATNRNLVDRIAVSEFREDLYYRLNVIHIRIPPLRERRDDIPALVHHYLSIYAEQYQLIVPEPTVEALAQLVAYDWPGNVRELKNVIERLVVRRPGRTITVDDLALVLSPRTPAPVVAVPTDTAEALFQRIVKDGESFWHAVYEPFMARDITRGDLRVVVTRGLEQTHGNCKRLVRLFNMDDRDYKRFLNFLHKHGCNLRFQQKGEERRAAEGSARRSIACDRGASAHERRA